MMEDFQVQQLKRLLAKFEEFKVIASQAMNVCEQIERELKGPHEPKNVP